MADSNTTNNNALNNTVPNYDLNRDENPGATGATEPATKHDVGIGGGIGAVGGAVVGALAGGPIGAVIGAVVGGAASAGAVDVVDKHDNDYDRTTRDHDATTLGSAPVAPGYVAPATPGYVAPAATEYAAPVDTVPADYASTAATTGYAPTDEIPTEEAQRLQLREEELRARTQTVQAGEVRIHKDVITETRSIDVPVTREELVIERHPVSGAAASNANFSQTEQEIRIPLMEEQVTLEKQAFVREEVEIGKRQVTETEHLTGTVRHEELHVNDEMLDEEELDEEELDASGNPVRPGVIR